MYLFQAFNGMEKVGFFSTLVFFGNRFDNFYLCVHASVCLTLSGFPYHKQKVCFCLFMTLYLRIVVLERVFHSIVVVEQELNFCSDWQWDVRFFRVPFIFKDSIYIFVVCRRLFWSINDCVELMEVMLLRRCVHHPQIMKRTRRKVWLCSYNVNSSTTTIQLPMF
jgi:hypothetical protein